MGLRAVASIIPLPSGTLLKQGGVKGFHSVKSDALTEMVGPNASDVVTVSEFSFRQLQRALMVANRTDCTD